MSQRDLLLKELIDIELEEQTSFYVSGKELTDEENDSLTPRSKRDMRRSYECLALDIEHETPGLHRILDPIKATCLTPHHPNAPVSP